MAACTPSPTAWVQSMATSTRPAAFGDKRGQWVWYHTVPDRLAQLRAALT